ncbi:MAG: hypothetical protein R3B54_08685 [Bdellovibrionota bacterium]
MEISKKLDEVIASLNTAPTDAKLSKKALKEAGVKGAPIEGDDENVEVDVKKINAEKLSQLTELAKAVQVSFDKESENNVFKKLLPGKVLASTKAPSAT